MARKERRGPLLVIGGREVRSGADAVILKRFVESTCDGPIVVITAATELHDDLVEEYLEVFAELGAEARPLVIRDRADALEDSCDALAHGAGGFFFTGGDQLKLTARLGGTKLLDAIVARHHEGAAIAGTSAGAAALSRAMIVSGRGDGTREADEIAMAGGLGLLDGLLVDTHFSERGRITRLVSAVARNPGDVGLGIDEDTAVLVTEEEVEVLGTGAVYFVDARRSGWSSLGAGERSGILRVHDLTLHVLAAGDRYDHREHRPIRPD